MLRGYPWLINLFLTGLCVYYRRNWDFSCRLESSLVHHRVLLGYLCWIPGDHEKATKLLFLPRGWACLFPRFHTLHKIQALSWNTL